MTIHEKIVAAYTDTRKVKLSLLAKKTQEEVQEQRSVYAGIVSDLSTLAKDKQVQFVEDKDFITYATRVTKANTRDVIGVINDSTNSAVIAARLENHTLSEYLPSKMTLVEVEEVLTQNNLTDMRSAAPYFKANFKLGTYDNSDIVEALSNAE